MQIEQVVAEALGSMAVEERPDACLWLGLSAGVDSTVYYMLLLNSVLVKTLSLLARN